MRLADQYITTQVQLALAEDVGDGDRTAQLVPAEAVARAEVIAREPAILCGGAWFAEVFRQTSSQVDVRWLKNDGDALAVNQRVCNVQGSARGLLTGERTALNFLQTLSGAATAAAAYVGKVAGTGARILDTRKTLPGLRLAQKYAVTCGGAVNHRIGLYDAVLIKENHIAAAGSIARALQQAAAAAGGVSIEIEVENLAQLEEALENGATHVLLDNFDLTELREAVALNAGRARLEASGGVSLETVRTIAETGVDDISVGDLTKHVHAVDFSMRFA